MQRGRRRRIGHSRAHGADHRGDLRALGHLYPVPNAHGNAGARRKRGPEHTDGDRGAPGPSNGHRDTGARDRQCRLGVESIADAAARSIARPCVRARRRIEPGPVRHRNPIVDAGAIPEPCPVRIPIAHLIVLVHAHVHVHVPHPHPTPEPFRLRRRRRPRPQHRSRHPALPQRWSRWSASSPAPTRR